MIGGIRSGLAAQQLPFEITDKNWSIFKNIYLQLDIGILDCLGEVKGVGSYEDAVKDSQFLTFEFGKCRALTVEALIRAKEAAGRWPSFARSRAKRPNKSRALRFIEELSQDVPA